MLAVQPAQFLVLNSYAILCSESGHKPEEIHQLIEPLWCRHYLQYVIPNSAKPTNSDSNVAEGTRAFNKGEGMEGLIYIMKAADTAARCTSPSAVRASPKSHTSTTFWK